MRQIASSNASRSSTTYANNNPLVFFDPDGRAACEPPFCGLDQRSNEERSGSGRGDVVPNNGVCEGSLLTDSTDCTFEPLDKHLEESTGVDAGLSKDEREARRRNDDADPPTPKPASDEGDDAVGAQDGKANNRSPGSVAAERRHRAEQLRALSLRQRELRDEARKRKRELEQTSDWGERRRILAELAAIEAQFDGNQIQVEEILEDAAEDGNLPDLDDALDRETANDIRRRDPQFDPFKTGGRRRDGPNAQDPVTSIEQSVRAGSQSFDSQRGDDRLSSFEEFASAGPGEIAETGCSNSVIATGVTAVSQYGTAFGGAVGTAAGGPATGLAGAEIGLFAQITALGVRAGCALGG